MEVHDWISLGIFVLAAIGALIAAVRYIDTQINEITVKTLDRSALVDRELSDKLSIGEYNRRHDDLERRIRAIERWQDHANGRARFYYPGTKEENEE